MPTFLLTTTYRRPPLCWPLPSRPLPLSSYRYSRPPTDAHLSLLAPPKPPPSPLVMYSEASAAPPAVTAASASRPPPGGLDLLREVRPDCMHGPLIRMHGLLLLTTRCCAAATRRPACHCCPAGTLQTPRSASDHLMSASDYLMSASDYFMSASHYLR